MTNGNAPHSLIKLYISAPHIGEIIQGNIIHCNYVTYHATKINGKVSEGIHNVLLGSLNFNVICNNFMCALLLKGAHQKFT